MDSENYKEGQSMQRPPLFEANCFIYWKNRFETYVKSKDIDLWYIIAHGNYKPTTKDKDVYEVVLEKDLESAKNKKEKYKSLALKARQVLSDEDASSSDSNDEEYAMAVRDFKKFFRRRGKFIRQPYDDKKNFRKVKEDKKEDRSGDDKEENFLMAHENEVLSDTPYYSSSSLDNDSRQNEYDKLCKISLRIINKNKHLKAKNELLKRNYNELKIKLELLEKNKDISNKCDVCDKLDIEINSLKLKLASFENSSSSLQKMVEIQKPSKDKCGLGYTEKVASSSNTKIKNLVKAMERVESKCPIKRPIGDLVLCTLRVTITNLVGIMKLNKSNYFNHLCTTNGVLILHSFIWVNQTVRQKVKLKLNEWIKDSGCLRHMTGNKKLFSSYKAIDGDHGREFDNEVQFGAFCDANGITHNFLAPRTPQSNRVVEQVYVAQPPGFVDFEKPNHVFKLKKALYGLKQAPKAWYDRLKAFLLDHLYTMGLVDNTLFTKKRNSHIIIVQIYVDDIIFGSTCQELCDDFLKIMHDEFEMSMMGELNFFLGLQIKQLKDGIFFNQYKYVKEMLKKFGLENSKPIKTPMSSETKLTRNENGESIDDTKYRGMIGSLLYLTASRSDIMFNVCLCARFQEALKTSHLEAVKRIFRYIKGTSHLGLWYPKGTGLETIIYVDSDHARDYVDRKSTSGVCTIMGCCLTSWFSKKQTALAISTTEAEYVSAGKACQQALWMKQALVDYDIKLDDIPVLCNNKGAINLSKNLVLHSRIKNIEIRHHFLHDNVQKGNITIEKVASEDNIADILTKPLKREPFNLLRLGLGLLEPNA
ncbi:retrovirus-related pol polyprotein from transposon TNT 1-94 [Tanacetum coccineum]